MELSDAEKAFEIEVREWLATNLPADPDHVARDRDALIAWQRKLASKFVAQQAVQLHGGIGVTEDLDVGHYFRRLTAFGNLFGDRDHHLRRFAALTQGSE